MKTLKFLVFAVLAMGMVVACSSDKLSENDVPEPELRAEGTLSPCMARTEEKMPPLTDIKTTIIKGYPQDQSLSSYIVIAKRFDDTEPAAYLVRGRGLATYRICNYPQYAKEWDIPENGLPVLLSGKIYSASFNPGFHSANQTFFDLELTILKSELP
jgi:hypothetical protein